MARPLIPPVRRIAAEFSLHDAPEGVLKDDTTPKKCTVAEKIEQRCGILAADIIKVLDEITDDHDAAIHEAAGLPWPMPDDIARAVKEVDIIMFVTEWRDLMKGIEHPNWAPYSNVKPLGALIQPWPWDVAKNALLRRWRTLLPALGGRIA
jgi:hypothetical protein